MTNDPSVQDELDALLLPGGDVSTRRMFGGLGYFVGDRLFAVYHRGEVATKLPNPTAHRHWKAGALLSSHPLLDVASVTGCRFPSMETASMRFCPGLNPPLSTCE